MCHWNLHRLKIKPRVRVSEVESLIRPPFECANRPSGFHPASYKYDGTLNNIDGVKKKLTFYFHALLRFHLIYA